MGMTQVSEEMADYPAKIYLEPTCTVNFERRWSTGQFEKCSEEGCDDCNNNDGAYVLAMRSKDHSIAVDDVERLSIEELLYNWQSDQSEWFNAEIREIVGEFARWYRAALVRSKLPIPGAVAGEAPRPSSSDAGFVTTGGDHSLTACSSNGLGAPIEALFQLAIASGELVVGTDGIERLRTERQRVLDELKKCEAIAPYLAASQADEMLDSIVATGGKVKVKFPKGTCQ